MGQGRGVAFRLDKDSRSVEARGVSSRVDCPMRTESNFLLILVLATLGACAGRRAVAPTPVPAAEANVIVYLSNQSTARRFVVLAVYVDDRLAMRKELASVF